MFCKFIQATLDKEDIEITEPPKVKANPFPPNQLVYMVDVQLPRSHLEGSSNMT